MTILGGTGIFAGATGLATATGNNSPPPPGALSPVYFSGAGQMTAPDVAAVPEPAGVVLVAAGLAGLIVSGRSAAFSPFVPSPP